MTNKISNALSSPINENQSNNKRIRGFWFSPVMLIRISSILFLFLTVGHTSAYPWNSSLVQRQKQVVASMRSVDFIFAGEHSSYWNLYFGWGLLAAALLLALTIILWLLSNMVHLAPRATGTIIAVFSATSLVGAYLSFSFFYIPPFVLYSVISVILMIVSLRLLRQN